MDIVPKKRSDRYSFYENIHENLDDEGPKFGLAVPDITATKAILAALLAKLDATDTAQSALDGAKASEKATEPGYLAQLRAKIRNWKTLPLYAASGSEGVLKLKGAAEPDFDPTAYKPVITVTLEAGKIKVEFDKKGVDGMAVYMRLRGQSQFRRIGTDTEAPYYDTAPLATPGVPETREYMARGMVGDDEIGLDSDIVSLTYAG